MRPHAISNSDQDSTQKECDPENITVSKNVEVIYRLPKTEPRYYGGQPAQTKKLSKFAQQIIWECAKDKRYKNVIQVWCEVDTYCKPKKYTPEQVGSFLRYCKKKLIHEHLKEKLNSATVKEPTINLLYVPTYLPLKRTNLTKKTPTTTNRQELVSRSLSGGVF